MGLVVVAFLAGIVVGPGVRGYLKRQFRPQLQEWTYYYRNYRQLSPGEVGNNGPAREIFLQDPMGVDADSNGNIYVSDRGRYVWKFAPGEPARIIAGNGMRGIPHEGQLATQSPLGLPEGIGVDGEGRVMIADSFNSVILRVEHDGTLTRIAGTGRLGYSGDGGPATQARLRRPFDVRGDGDGNIYIADFGNNVIRRITPEGIISTLAGTGEAGYGGDGGPATSAQLDGPYGVFPNGNGAVFIADSHNHVIRRVNSENIIATVAGTGEAGYSGDGGPAIEARFNAPQSFYIPGDGRIYVNDEHNSAVRVIDADGIVRTIAGTGKNGIAADGMPGIEASFNDTENIAVLDDGSVMITDGDNGFVWRLGPDGRLRHFAGRGLPPGWR